MGATFSRVKNWGAEILTFLSLNAEFDNILDNLDPDGVDDASVSAAAMQANADPYPGSAISLPTSLRGEFQRLRYLLKQQHITSQWYIFPDLVSKTGAYTAAVDDRVILCDGTSGAFTVTLPTAVGVTDKVFYIKKTDSSANAITIDGSGSEEIDGLTTRSLVNQYEFIMIVSDGANWQALSHNADTIQQWRKGADVASATALTLGSDGNYFDVTGTTTIASIAAKGVGTVVKVHFDGILTLTHHATDLVLPGGANITTAAGDEAEFIEYVAGDWRCTNYSTAAASPSSAFTGFSANKNNVDQSIPTGTPTKVIWAAEGYDNGSYFDLANDKWTPPAGKIHIDIQVQLDILQVNQGSLYLYKDGALFKRKLPSHEVDPYISFSGDFDVDGTNYFEVYVEHDNGANRDLLGDTKDTYFNGHVIK